jgi:hypothetical protein
MHFMCKFITLFVVQQLLWVFFRRGDITCRRLRVDGSAPQAHSAESGAADCCRGRTPDTDTTISTGTRCPPRLVACSLRVVMAASSAHESLVATRSERERHTDTRVKIPGCS